METRNIMLLIPVIVMLFIQVIFAGNKLDPQVRIRDMGVRLEFVIERIDRIENGLAQMPESEFPKLRNQLEAFKLERDGLSNDLAECRDLVAQGRLLEAGNRLDQIRERLDILSRKIDKIIEDFIKYGKFGVNRVEKAVERTDRAIMRATQLLRKSGENEDAVTGLRKASDIQEEAKQKLESRNFMHAYKLTLEAREVLARTVKSSLDDDDIAALVERAKEYWEKTNSMITRIGKELNASADPKASSMLSKAEEFQEKAQEAWKNKDPLVAMREAKEARRIAAGLLVINRKAGNAEDEIENLDFKAERAEDIVGHSGDQKALRILDKGKEFLQKAHDLLESGDQAGAVAKARVAAKLIAKAVDVAGK